MNADQYIALLDSRIKQTDHVVHLILSVMTWGLWLPVWVFLDVRNANRTNSIYLSKAAVRRCQAIGLREGGVAEEIEEIPGGFRFVSLDAQGERRITVVYRILPYRLLHWGF